MKSYKKYMTGLLAAAFCWTGAVFAADNPFETAEDEIYNGRFTSEKVDLRLEQSDNKEAGRFFVGDLRINGISHLVLARGANGALIGTMGEIENKSDGKETKMEYANGASFRFMFQRQSDGKYLLQIGENEASQVLEKQTFPKLEKSYRGKDGLSLKLNQKLDDPKVYTGTVGFKGRSIPFTSVVNAGVLQGTMILNTNQTSFIIENNGDTLFFVTGGYKDELVEEKILTVELNDKVSLDMVWIEPGTFTMGSPKDELGRGDDETQHQVTLTKGYWLGKYEITQAQYEIVMGKNPSEDYGVGSDYPVYNVSWNDAMNFCAKLTESENAEGRLPNGYKYTLPTEAQWEYACRAGTTTALNSGKNLTAGDRCPEMDEVGWYYFDINDKKAYSVGQKKPNACGLYDMHGNVMEWCLDWYGEYPTTSVTDPTGAFTGSRRVIRDGSWGHAAGSCRSAHRSSISPNINVDYHIGFRLALVPVQ